MGEENTHRSDAGFVEPGSIKPVLSSRRRLQNREAQRRYREKTKKKDTLVESPMEDSDCVSSPEWNIGSNTLPVRDQASPAIEFARRNQISMHETSQYSSPASTPPTSSSSVLNRERLWPSDGSYDLLDTNLISPQGGNSLSVVPLQASPYLQNLQPTISSSFATPSLYQLPHSAASQFNSSLNLQSLSSAKLQAPKAIQPLLHIAVQTCKRDMVTMLLERGAVALDDQNCQGATALHVATELGDEGMVAHLLRYGADSCIHNAQGQDALHIAVSNGHTGIAELVLEKRKKCSESFSRSLN